MTSPSSNMFGSVKNEDPVEQEEVEVDAPGMLSRADSGSSTTSDGRGSSLFSMSEVRGHGDRRSSFASSVRSGMELEDEEGEGEQLDGKSTESSSYSSAASSFCHHPDDLQTPTVERGAAVVTVAATSTPIFGRTPLSLADRLQEIQLQESAARRASAVSMSLVDDRVSSSSSSNPARLPRPSTSSSTTNDGFPWNAHNSNMRTVSSSSSSSTAVGTPSAIFSGPDNLEQDEHDDDDEQPDFDWREPLADPDDVKRSWSGEGAAVTTGSTTHSTAATSSSSSSPRNTRSSFSSSTSSSRSGGIRRSPLQSTTDMLATRHHSAAAAPSNLFNSHSSGLSSAPSSPATIYQPIMQSSGSASSSRSRHFSTDDGPSAGHGHGHISKHKSSSSAQLRSSPVHVPTSARPSTASSTGSSRPWVKDSDASSIKSSTSAVSSSDGSPHEESGDTLSVMSPAAPPPVPFLSTAPQPAGCRISVDSAPDHFAIIAILPGFTLENITLALKRNGSLHILADRYDDTPTTSSSATGGGHFERMVELGESAIGSKVSAEFDGKRLKVTVRKRETSAHAHHSRKQSTGSSSMRSTYSNGGGSSSGTTRSAMITPGQSQRTGAFAGIPSPPLMRNRSSQGFSSSSSSRNMSFSDAGGGGVNPFSHAVGGSYRGGITGRGSL